MRAYISGTSAISPQQTFQEGAYLQDYQQPEKGYFSALEPEYRQYIDPKLSRRMARIIKMSVAAARKSLEQSGLEQPGAITVGTGLGCLQDTEKFLAEIVETGEGLLSPTAFIQSTHNTIAGQIALLLACPQHNFTFVQRGFSFECALEDALLLLAEGTEHVLVGGVDEVTPTLHQILTQIGCAGNNSDQQANPEPADKKPLWGEGASFFVLSAEQTTTAVACIEGIHTFYGPAGEAAVEQQTQQFLQSLAVEPAEIDAVMMGFSGSAADDEAYHQLSRTLFAQKPVLSFKNLCGEYFTASAFGLHLAAKTLEQQKPFSHTLREGELSKPLNKLLLYNHSQGKYHSLMLLSACRPL